MRKTIIIHVEGFQANGHLTQSPTPLERASTPELEALTACGELGRLGVPGETRTLKGEMVLLALMGYDTHKWHAGAGPFAAAGLEVTLDKHDVAFLCDLVTIRAQDGWGEGKKLGPQVVMDDPCAGGISDEEARELIDAINEQLVSENIQFYMGHGYRHLMVWAGMNGKIVCGNPIEALGKPVEPYLPTGEGAQVLRELLEASRVILSHHELNRERVADGQKPANCLWFWSPGKALEIPRLSDVKPVKGVVISSESPILGAGVTLGLHTVRVAAVQESMETFLKELVSLCGKAVEKTDLVYVHLVLRGKGEDPEGEVVRQWEAVDAHFMGPLRQCGFWGHQARCLVVGTPLIGGEEAGQGTGIAGYLFIDDTGRESSPDAPGFHEKALANRPVKDATKFLERLVS